MKLRPYKDGDEVRVDAAYSALKKALRLLNRAGATKAADRVRRALRSAQGAQRHVHRIAEHAEQALWGEVKNNAVGKRTKDEMLAAIKCPECGELPEGTVEDILGCTASFDLDDEGKAQYTGDTDVNWDGQGPRLDEETGRPLLFCRCGKEYPAPKGFEI